jgi:hypothetical protein
MHLPAAITNALALANSAWSSAEGASADSPSALASKVLLGVEFKELHSMCSPPTADAVYNLTFPCNQNDVIQTQCYYGRTFDEVWNSTTGDYVNTSSWTPQGPLNQRLCACESQLFDTLAGCNSCYKAHGAGLGRLDEAEVSSMSSSYCAASSTPTVGLLHMMSEYFNSPQVTSKLHSAISEAKTSTYSDPLAGSTAVSYYYTPSVTGTAVFNIAGVTHGATPTTTKVADGQITANSGAGAIGSGLGGLKVAFAAVLTLMASVVLL